MEDAEEREFGEEVAIETAEQLTRAGNFRMYIRNNDLYQKLRRLLYELLGISRKVEMPVCVKNMEVALSDYQAHHPAFNRSAGEGWWMLNGELFKHQKQ